uniref:Protein kinase family protein n=1 Tax=Arundo donax TaxID=35708 RepID=A0A0A9A3D8_ARUDO
MVTPTSARSCGSYLKKTCLKKMLIGYFPFLLIRQTFIPEKGVL